MGFLSRKSTPEEEPQAEQDQAPDSPVETIEPTPDATTTRRMRLMSQRTK